MSNFMVVPDEIINLSHPHSFNSNFFTVFVLKLSALLFLFTTYILLFYT